MIQITTFGSGSAGNSYLIDDGFSQLILEAGVSLKTIKEKMKHDLSQVVGVLVSHEHRDHCKYIKALVDETSADIYATKGTITEMFNDPVLNLKRLNMYRFRPVKYKETIKIGTWYVTPFETKHDVAEPCGFLIDNTSGDRLVFITDSYYVRYQFPRVTHMMIEANYSEEIIDENLRYDSFGRKLKTRIKSSHFDLANTIEFVKINASHLLQEIHLIHLSDSNSNAKQFKKDVQKVSGVPVYIA